MCCCTISVPMRRQMRAIRLSVFRQMTVRVCTPLGNLRTAEKVTDQKRVSFDWTEVFFIYLKKKKLKISTIKISVTA